ncbi:MAG: hypothetical protein Q7S87_01415 [Agitococcus sp.]|nr:hypothetical protein [Agitococcus sp.]MDO9177119.1 hypothetical protein [Agitococcus sp.]
MEAGDKLPSTLKKSWYKIAEVIIEHTAMPRWMAHMLMGQLVLQTVMFIVLSMTAMWLLFISPMLGGAA